MNYEEQAKRYGISFEDFMGMMRENAEEWEAQVIAEQEKSDEIV